MSPSPPPATARAPAAARISDWEYFRYFIVLVVVAGGITKLVFIIMNAVRYSPDYIGPLVVLCVSFLLGIFLSHRFYYGTWRKDDYPIDYCSFILLTLLMHCLPVCLICVYLYFYNYMVYREYFRTRDNSQAIGRGVYYGELYYCICVWVLGNLLALVAIFFDPFLKCFCLSRANQLSDRIAERLPNDPLNLTLRGGGRAPQGSLPESGSTSAAAAAAAYGSSGAAGRGGREKADAPPPSSKQGGKYTVNRFAADEYGADAFGKDGIVSSSKGRSGGGGAPPPPPPPPGGGLNASKFGPPAIGREAESMEEGGYDGDEGEESSAGGGGKAKSSSLNPSPFINYIRFVRIIAASIYGLGLSFILFGIGWIYGSSTR